MSDWWERLTLKEQEEYLKEHPGSKRKITQTTEQTIKQATGKTVKPIPKTKLGKLGKFIKENPGKFALAAATTMVGHRQRFNDNIDGMPIGEQNNLANAIRTAIHLKDSRGLREVATKVGLQTGVLFIGAVGFSLVTGINISLVVPLLASNFWERIQDVPDNVEYLKNAGKAYFDQVQENMQDDNKLLKAMKQVEPDVVIDNNTNNNTNNNTTEIPSKNDGIEKSYMFQSTHSSDLNKALVKIEKLDIEKATTNVLQKNSVVDIIDHTKKLETLIPVIASIMVSVIPDKDTLSERAQNSYRQLLDSHNRCFHHLLEVGKTIQTKRSPLSHTLGKLFKFESINYGVLPINSEIGNCELHQLFGVRHNNLTYSQVNIYSYKQDNELHMASVINSNYIPLEFTAIKPRQLKTWLLESMEA